MRKILLNWFFRFYGGKAYKQFGEKKADILFDFLAKTEETKRMGDFYRQCADAYKTKYLYTADESLKGAILAFTQLAEKFEEHKPKNKMKQAAKEAKFVGNRKRAVKY